MSFEFLNYSFDEATGVAEFWYRNGAETFAEKVTFAIKRSERYDKKALERALFLAFMVLGTSYYKVAAGREVKVGVKLDEWQAKFFDKVYQEGLSQFAFENGLTRDNLAHFVASEAANEDTNGGAVNSDSEASAAWSGSTEADVLEDERALVLVSGGKDSLLTLEMLREQGTKCYAMYITSQESYPEIVDEAAGEMNPVIVRREIDKEALKRAGGMNGHVPVTIINEALALVQAILLRCGKIALGIGMEGMEAHAWIDDLPVNHQWSKTAEAQKLLREYVKRYISADLTIDLPLEKYDELAIAQMFAEKCWTKYGDKFSSCNVANYKQDANNRELKWCGKCAKCANSYLLFAPFVAYEEQKKIFGHDLFEDADLTEIYKGLLGVDGVMKPFECVASRAELKKAYRDRLPGYGELPFEI